jgi:HEPN domain-containing protein
MDTKPGELVGDSPTINAMNDRARIAMEAGLAFFGSRDFLLAWELLEQHHRAPEVRAARAPWPRQAAFTCAAFSLELALKARLVLDGNHPEKEHRYSELFRALSPAAAADIAARVQIEGRPATAVDGLLELLKECDRTFEQFRYLHERLARLETTTFYGDRIIPVTRAVHAAIVALRPDFGPWPGAISG